MTHIVAIAHENKFLPFDILMPVKNGLEIAERLAWVFHL